jgi:hypothetical protein
MAKGQLPDYEIHGSASRIDASYVAAQVQSDRTKSNRS